MTLEDNQERAADLAHEIIVAATNGDEAGAEALYKVFRIKIDAILNMVRQPAPDIS